MLKRNLKVIGTILLVILWMLIIYNFSSKPSNESNVQSKRIIQQLIGKTNEKSNTIQNDQNTKVNQKEDKLMVEKCNILLRKGAHASIYFVLAILILISMLQMKDRKILQCNIIAILICFLYACTDEYHQTFVIGRTGNVLDVLIDTGGAILGCILFDFYLKQKISKNKI